MKDKSFYCNTFTISVKFIEQIITHPQWELIAFRLKSARFCGIAGGSKFLLSFRKQLFTLAVGWNYGYEVEQGAYQQDLYQTMMRAHDLNCDGLFLSMDRC